MVMDISHPLSRPRSSATGALALRQSLWLAIAAGMVPLLAMTTVAMLWMCDWHMVYSLDDPLISLAMGWHIAQGQWGINATEPSSPASSILYPLVLAGFAWTRWQLWAPLVLNTGAALGTALAFGSAACRFGIVTERAQVSRAAILITVLCVALNIVGVAFVGLEHSLHTLTCVLVAFGLARAFDEGRAPAWLIFAIVLLPLWRFEGAAFALLAIGALVLTGQWRSGLVALCGVVLSLGLYMAAMHALGLPLLPSSVLAKSPIATDVVESPLRQIPLLRTMLSNLSDNVGREAAPILVLTGLVLLRPLYRLVRPGGVRRWTLWQEFVFAGAIAGTMVAHLLFGRFGGFLRYGVYAGALGVAGALALWRPQLGRYFRNPNLLADLLAVTVMLLVGLLYVVGLIETPLAARGIYEQQYQMRRLAVDYYRAPVAVNDLGWVSYRNPSYVLDLGGLGSEAVRQAMGRQHSDPGWVGRMVGEHQIGLVMVYADKFTGLIPPSWIKVATLYSPHYIARELDTVTFYATSTAALPQVTEALRAFDRDKGADVSLNRDFQ